MLVATTQDGVLAFDTYLGAVNADQFLDFVMTDLIQYLQPYPNPRSVILLDNIAYHHDPIFIQLVEEMDVMVFHLPHYDPLYNLTEYAFRDMKSIERMKNVYGEEEALLSLVDTLNVLKNKSYKKTLKKIGYIQ